MIGLPGEIRCRVIAGRRSDLVGHLGGIVVQPFVSGQTKTNIPCGHTQLKALSSSNDSDVARSLRHFP